MERIAKMAFIPFAFLAYAVLVVVVCVYGMIAVDWPTTVTLLVSSTLQMWASIVVCVFINKMKRK